MHTVFCIIGRSASGKSSITKEVAKRLGLKILKSYTTRPMRPGETPETSDHIFITSEQVAQYNHVAYTKINDYEYFATQEQLDECDLYIIDPKGFYELYSNVSKDTKLVPIYIALPQRIARCRAIERGDDILVWEGRISDENDQFTAFEERGAANHVIVNDGTLEDAITKLTEIIQQYR